MNSVRYVGLDVHRDTISAAVLDESGRLMQQSSPGHASGRDSGFYRRDARNSARHLRGRNAFGLALRSIGAAGGPAGGVQPAQERVAEVGQQERRDRRAQAGGVVARRYVVAGVSRREQRAGGAASGAELHHADRRHDAGDGAAEGGVSRPGDCLRGQEALWPAASRRVSGAVGAGACGGARSVSTRSWRRCSRYAARPGGT